MTISDDRLLIAALAHRRYPDVPLPLAMAFFASDRRTAGLGALDERKRSRGFGEVRNLKSLEPMGDVVLYRRIIDVRERWEYPRMPLPDLSEPVAETTTVTAQRVPARFVEKWLKCDRRDFFDQRGRRRVAWMLRELRRQATRKP